LKSARRKVSVYSKSVLWVMGFAAFGWCVTSAYTPAKTARVAAAQAAGGRSLDFQVYKARIEPIFLKEREGGIRCYNCHSVLPTRLHLETLSEGKSAWSEEQSRRNFEIVSQLVTPGDPLKSRLLLHPLGPEAGGDPNHTGGKFWKTQNDPEWKMIAAWVGSGSGAKAEGVTESSAQVPLDFEFFKTRVEPIFLKKRPSHSRCYACHSDAESNRFKLQKLSPGSTFWTDEQSRLNFQAAAERVIPGDPEASLLVMKPLAPEVGGYNYHEGGRQFESKTDPDWQTLVEWVRGAKAKRDN
jgi:hypothetical protein